MTTGKAVVAYFLVGSVINEDTYKGTLGNTQSQNGYAYVENNPINWIDPSGHIKDSFGAALTMPKTIEDTAPLISMAQTNGCMLKRMLIK